MPTYTWGNRLRVPSALCCPGAGPSRWLASGSVWWWPLLVSTDWVSWCPNRNVEELCRFPELPTRKPLTYQAQQLIAHEIEMEKMRRAEARAMGSPQVSSPRAPCRARPGGQGSGSGPCP